MDSNRKRWKVESDGLTSRQTKFVCQDVRRPSRPLSQSCCKSSEGLILARTETAAGVGTTGRYICNNKNPRRNETTGLHIMIDDIVYQDAHHCRIHPFLGSCVALRLLVGELPGGNYDRMVRMCFIYFFRRCRRSLQNPDWSIMWTDGSTPVCFFDLVKPVRDPTTDRLKKRCEVISALIHFLVAAKRILSSSTS